MGITMAVARATEIHSGWHDTSFCPAIVQSNNHGRRRAKAKAKASRRVEDGRYNEAVRACTALASAAQRTHTGRPVSVTVAAAS